MCTSISVNLDKHYFGRNLDLDSHFGERVVVTPRNYTFTFKCEKPLEKHFALVGMASVYDNYPLYADCANEKGLCMAGLNFNGYAKYSLQKANGKYNIAPHEIIPWILCHCRTVDEAVDLMRQTQLVAMSFSPSLPIATLHWHIADKSKSVVVECTERETSVCINSVGVLTNNPPFDFHMENLSQYLNLSVQNPSESTNLQLKPFSNGFGGIGLPGDFSSASRFVKAAFLRNNCFCPVVNGVQHFFHLLDAVAVPAGAVSLPSEKVYKTNYSCCIDSDSGVYYYKTYENSSVRSVDMHKTDIDGASLVSFDVY